MLPSYRRRAIGGADCADGNVPRAVVESAADAWPERRTVLSGTVLRGQRAYVTTRDAQATKQSAAGVVPNSARVREGRQPAAKANVDDRGKSDETLAAEAAREGSDGPAFVAIMDRFRDRVWRICYRLLDNEHDAADAAQEVFVRLFLHRARFAGKSRYSTWVHGLAVRTCLEQRRSRGRRLRRVAPAGEGVLESASQPAAEAASGVGLDLKQMLDSLDETDRALVLLKYAEGHSYEELAEMFDLSVSACKMRVSRARDRMQQRFGDAND